MGYWSMVGAGGPVIGVVAGGPIVESFGWRWIFIAQVPLTLCGLLLGLLMLPETEKRDRVAFDWAGAVVLAVRSEEHTSEFQSLKRNMYAAFTSEKKKINIF